MTIARLAGLERYKGIDEVIRILPRVRERIPSIMYLVMGEGTDRARLERLVATVGVGDHVRFLGYVPEEDKAAHLRLSDGFVMPSRGEGFGIVYLEAMACGVPVLASKLDAGREALLEGRLGVLVDPRDADELLAGVLSLLSRPKGVVPPELQLFSHERFRERWIEVADRVFLPGMFSSGRERVGPPAGAGTGSTDCTSSDEGRLL
jgi:phosphatidylinositol alpha-1,6-mannosyltransferase